MNNYRESKENITHIFFKSINIIFILAWTNMKISKQLAARERADAIQFTAAGRGPLIKTFKYDPTKQKRQSTVLTKNR